jgi:hypothetical protein
MDISLTGIGEWNPLLFVAAFVIIMLMVYLFRSLGNKDYDTGTGQVKSFLSGNADELGDTAHAGDIYWGFLSAFEKPYKLLIEMHSGNINDYAGIFTLVFGVLIVILMLT